MLKQITETQKSDLDKIVIDFGNGIHYAGRTMLHYMADCLIRGYDIGGYLGVYKALSRLYDGQVKAQQS